MKPLHLRMSAFGPFCSPTELDFTQANEQGIYLISGPTGSGKTTIFDAIAFALFGKASGSNRLSENFRSRQAAPQAICEVELTFSLGDRVYTVRRRPRQSLPSSRKGGRLVEQQHRASLTLPDGRVLDSVSEVDSCIESLLGLNCDQFRKIVMLAQGEFRRLLDAGSSERIPLFRQIFSTWQLNDFTLRLNARFKELHSQVKGSQELIDGILRQLIDAGVSALAEYENPGLLPAEQISDAVQAVITQKKQLAAAQQTRLEQLRSQRESLGLAAAEELLGQFQRLEMLRKKQAKLAAQQSEMLSLAQILALLDAAERIVPLEKRLTELSGKCSAADTALQAASQTLQQTKKALNCAEAELRLIPAREERREALFTRAAELTGKIERLAQRDKAHARLQAAEQNAANSSKQLEMLSLLLEHRTLLDRKSILEQRCKKIDLLREKVLNARRQKDIWQQAKQTYTMQYELFLGAQAGELAASLKEGVPCPVCGAFDHPAPALPVNGAPNRERVNALHNEMTSAWEGVQQLITECRSLRCEIRLDDPDFFPDESALWFGEMQMEQKIKVLRLEADELRTHADEQKRQLLTVCTGQTVPDANTEELARRHSEAEDALRTHLTSVNTLKTILAPFADLTGENTDAATQELSRLEEERRTLADNIRLCRDQHAQASERHTRQTTLCENLARQREQYQQELAKAQSDFDEALSLHGFSDRPAYTEALAALPHREAYTEQLTRYREELLQTTARYKELSENLSGREPPQLETLRKQDEALKRAVSSCEETLAELRSSAADLSRKHSDLLAACTRIETLRTQAALAERLSRCASGENQQAITFETYLLAAYFEDTIQLSNLHLAQMSGGRYQLCHMEGTARHGAKSGLDLEILDRDNGCRRPVSTLSGGEGFKASLALALGLADTLRVYSGAVHLETVFIDEGFGSLDEQARRAAVDTLLSLRRQGRVVGIISHMESLRESIPTVLQVSPAPGGSTAVFL